MLFGRRPLRGGIIAVTGWVSEAVCIIAGTPRSLSCLSRVLQAQRESRSFELGMRHGDGRKQFQTGSQGAGGSCGTALPGMVGSDVSAVKDFVGFTQLHSLLSGLGHDLRRPAHNSAMGRTALTSAP